MLKRAFPAVAAVGAFVMVWSLPRIDASPMTTDSAQSWSVVTPPVTEWAPALGPAPLRAGSSAAASAESSAPGVISAGDPVTVVAAGDIACDPTNDLFNGGLGSGNWCRAALTARLIQELDPTVVLPLGDEQYDDGRLSKFRRSYDLSWGTERWRSRPVPGNHEYSATSTAAGYFSYFGQRAGPAGRGWYAYDLGAWRLIALNSNCRYFVGCASRSPQYDWLKQELTANRAECTLAYFHHPRFSSGPHGGDPELRYLDPMWELLYAHGVDVVVNSHDHIYERFQPMDPRGHPEAETGIRQFTVGTGGAQLYRIYRVHRASEVREARTFGVLNLTLRQGSYSWRFVPVGDATFTDTGTATCHGRPAA